MSHPSERSADAGSAKGPLGRVRRLSLLTAIALASLNAWTGSPLLALWVGSRVQGAGPPEMGAVFVVAGTLGAISYGLIRLLRVLGDAYDRATGRPPTIREHTPWLRSMRDGRPHETGSDTHVSAFDALLVTSVLLAVAAFEVWFFFFSTSSIDSRSGR
jgi:hypothetical protein